MKTTIILAALSLLLLCACETEKAPEPSGKDRDWFGIEHDSEDPLDHLIYQLYDTKGIAVFYNDTLGQEERTDREGNVYTHYETIRMGYNLTGGWVNVGSYTLAKDREDIRATVELLKESVFPKIPENLIARSYLVVDTLWVKDGALVNSSAYQDLTTTFIGRVDSVPKMNNEQKKQYSYEIVSVVMRNYLQNNNPEGVEKFYKLTTDIAIPPYSSHYSGSFSKNANPKPSPSPETYGFLFWKAEDAAKYSTISKVVDMESYLMMIYTREESWVQNEYKNFPVVLSKYKLLKELLAQIK